MAHNYYLPPFGPFRRFVAELEHVELLRRLDALLSPCEHHAAYLRRYGPPGLMAQPLFAADYHYFHRSDGRGGLQLPEAMRPWEAPHRFVMAVSPCPEKGLAVLLALARRLPDVAFAAVTTQWSGAPSVDVLRSLPNMTVLAPHDDVDVIFKQTRVLLAPSLWQECCPLVVMESLLRGIPCVSSDVCGLPEANRNPRLVVPTSLSYDFARGELRHGADLKRGARVSDTALAQSGVRKLPAAVTYRVVRSPFVFIRAAPSTEAEVLGMAPVGTCVVADAERSGWLRTAPQPGLQGGWALIDGASLGLGVLLQPT